MLNKLGPDADGDGRLFLRFSRAEKSATTGLLHACAIRSYDAQDTFSSRRIETLTYENVADDIGKTVDPEDVAAFIDRHPELIGTVSIEGIAQPFEITRANVENTANKFLKAVDENHGETGAIARDGKEQGEVG